MIITGDTIEYNRGFIGGFYIRPSDEGGDFHRHWIPHLMFIERGAYRIEWFRQGGETQIIDRIEAPNFLEVLPDAHHRAIPLEPNSRRRCLFAKAEVYRMEFRSFLIQRFGEEQGALLFSEFEASEFGSLDAETPYWEGRPDV